MSDRVSGYVSGILAGTAEKIGKPYGVDTVEFPDSESFKMGAPSGAAVQAVSWMGATLGSPLGFLPVLGTVYAAGLAQIHGQGALLEYLPSRIPPAEFIQLVFRGYVNEDNMGSWLREMGEQGWSSTRLDELVRAARPVFGAAEIRDLYLRGEFGEGEGGLLEAKRRLGQLGYLPEDMDLLINLFFYIPPVQDMIRMVVREAWRDDIAKTYGTDDQYEKLPFDEFAKAGVSPEWLQKYWRAHWELPPLTQAFQMFHRGIITRADLDELLRVQDVMPYWRDKITAVAYNPLTRVDVRRMYRLGVLDRAQILRAYGDIGYSPKNAELMTQFTEKYENRDDEDTTTEYRDLTRSMIVSGYRENLIGKPRASTELMALDYSIEDADFILSLEDARASESELKAELGFIGRAYVSGSMTREVMLDRLGKLNLDGDRMDYYTAKWDRDQVTKSLRPSVADWRRWFKLGLITRETFDVEMTTEGYSLDYIELYASEVAE